MNRVQLSNAMFTLISTRLQPGVGTLAAVSRFNGLFAGGKPLKRFSHFPSVNTGLKPGANEKALNFEGLNFQNQESLIASLNTQPT